MRAATYAKRPAPTEYDRGFWDIELGNLQRAIVPTVVRTVTANTRQQINDTVILVDATAAPVTVTLLAPALATVFLVLIKKIDATANAVTLSGTVDGTVNPQILTPMVSLTLQSDGSTWWIV